ncbi:M56 family metallopeptidase [Verrucomicrobiaceae bacterium N1E253]|uniref:M56 family metallopeptidase n=1 Tax=Oceaniferula marina TaxID=2748318 RepID=A0A851GI64_9BACT|nr:M56 family metallopeptidase [Oceaniferula marina]NWK57213.1 M56 family metallopeptidase [Oceaniferula marina]
MMSILLSSLMISVLAAAGLWLIARKDPAGWPWVTVWSLGLLLFLPLLSLCPKWHMQSPVMADAADRVSSGGGLVSALLVLWALGTMVMMFRLFWRHRCLRQWLMCSTPVDRAEGDGLFLLEECCRMLGVKRVPELRMKEGLYSPVVAGYWKPVIVMPYHAEAWSPEMRKMAILHELGHIQRWDLWMRLAAELCCALYWYNPIVYWMRSRLMSQCEYACDARVIRAGVDKKHYIGALCDVAERMLESRARVISVGGLAMADHASLKRRVDRMLVQASSQGGAAAALVVLVTFVSALASALVEPVNRPSWDVIPGVASPADEMSEVELRHSANPFPGN